jgi:hypothetical protein
MELIEHDWPARVMKSGMENDIALIAGEKIRVQTYVGGEIVDVLAEQTCPEGKAWSARVIVEITETDA